MPVRSVADIARVNSAYDFCGNDCTAWCRFLSVRVWWDCTWSRSSDDISPCTYFFNITIFIHINIYINTSLHIVYLWARTNTHSHMLARSKHKTIHAIAFTGPRDHEIASGAYVRECECVREVVTFHFFGTATTTSRTVLVCLTQRTTTAEWNQVSLFFTYFCVRVYVLYMYVHNDAAHRWRIFVQYITSPVQYYQSVRYQRYSDGTRHQLKYR